MNLIRLLAFLSFSILPLAAHAEVHQAQGEFAGEVTASSALLQSRLTAIPGPALDADGDVPGAAGVACFEWSEAADFADAESFFNLQEDDDDEDDDDDR